MTDYRNRMFAEIAVGETVSTTRALTATDVDALAFASGDVEPLHIAQVDAASTIRTVVQGAASVALIAALLSRRLPGPGSAIVGTRLRYGGSIRVGDTLTATVTARAKDAATRCIEFECRCVNQAGDVLIDGIATVTASDERIAYSNLATPELILRRSDGFASLFQACQGLLPVSCAIVHPCDRDSLQGSIEAAKLGLIVPVLVGPEAKIRATAKAEHIDLAPYRIVATEHSHAAADRAVAMARRGEVESLMKGSLHTDELMAAVVATATGLRTDKRISHVFVMDVPAYPRLLMVTDAAVNITPDLECKAGICQNAIALAHVLGIAEPKAAILSAVETVTPKIPSTVDAAALCKWPTAARSAAG